MFERPEYAVVGKRQYDQNWIDGNVEAGVGACGWQRPAKRPPALDLEQARSRPRVAAPAPVAKQPGIVRRTLSRVLPRPRPGSIEPVPINTHETILPSPVSHRPEPAPVAAVEDVPPPPPRREPIDELLSPSTSAPPEPPKRRCRFGVLC